MTSRNPRLFAIMIGPLVGGIAVVPVARAQSAPAEPSQNTVIPPAEQSRAIPTESPAPWPDQAPVARLTRWQLDAFATLVGESTEVVLRRMAADPGMIPLAVEAADARMKRRGRGHMMAVLGFSGFGVGTAAAIFGAVLLSRSDSSRCSQGDVGCLDQLVDTELIVAGALAVAGGFVLGFCGVDKLNSQSEAETKALDRYKPVGTDRPQTVPPSDRSFSGPLLPRSALSGKSFRLPLLSFTF